jgi:oligopeptide transport system permease protein
MTKMHDVQEANLGINQNDFVLREMPAEIFDSKFETESIGFLKDAWLRFSKNRTSIVAFIIICILILLAIFGPMLNEYGYNDQDLARANLPARIQGFDKFNALNGSTVLKNRRKDNLQNNVKYPESCILEIMNETEINGVTMCDVRVNYYVYSGYDEDYFWFGTDYLGRDLWTRVWRGVRISLTIAFAAVLTNVIFGVIYGAIAGFYGGAVDLVMMRIAEILQAFPNIIVMTLFIMYFGRGLFAIIMALVVRDWVGTAMLIRAQFYRYKNSEYVLAARTLGAKDSLLIFRHVLPNAIGPIVTRTMIAIPSAIFAESFLAYIGLGVRPPEASLGVLLSNAQTVLLQYPYQTVFPAILISLLMISFNLFGNGLRDAFDPTQRGT